MCTRCRPTFSSQVLLKHCRNTARVLRYSEEYRSQCRLSCALRSILRRAGYCVSTQEKLGESSSVRVQRYLNEKHVSFLFHFSLFLGLFGASLLRKATLLQPRCTAAAVHLCSWLSDRLRCWLFWLRCWLVIVVFPRTKSWKKVAACLFTDVSMK